MKHGIRRQANEPIKNRCTNKWVFVSLLIGWKSGARFFVGHQAFCYKGGAYIVKVPSQTRHQSSSGVSHGGSKEQGVTRERDDWGRVRCRIDICGAGGGGGGGLSAGSLLQILFSVTDGKIILPCLLWFMFILKLSVFSFEMLILKVLQDCFHDSVNVAE